MSHLRRGLQILVMGSAIACGTPTPDGGEASSQGSNPSDSSAQSMTGVAVFHLRNRVATAALSGSSAGEYRVKIEDYYPAACIDTDDDSDGVPDSLQPSMVDDSSADAGDDDSDSDDSLRCQKCNRGPGTAGDFRLRMDADEAELPRGTVFSITATEIVVKSPDGDLLIALGADTVFEDGTPTPGAEIRVRGTPGAQPLTINAERVKVLCPGPTPMEESEVPEMSDGEGSDDSAGDVGSDDAAGGAGEIG